MTPSSVHGGGWTVFNDKFSDIYLSHITDTANLVTISVEYRLAPEHPFPEGPEDCFDVAEYLVVNSKAKLGAELSFIDGSSSGAHFAALTALHLRKSYPEFHLRGLVLKYGIFDLTYTNPSIVNAKDPIIVTHEALKHTTEAFVPNTTLKDRQNPDISPIYADLQALSPLPPGIFVCGTRDILMDDSIFFSAKWMMVNSKTVLKMFPGALHGFVDFEGMPMLQEGYDTITDFLVRM
jgi:acetyl esterase/lipase